MSKNEINHSSHNTSMQIRRKLAADGAAPHIIFPKTHGWTLPMLRAGLVVWLGSYQSKGRNNINGAECLWWWWREDILLYVLTDTSLAGRRIVAFQKPLPALQAIIQKWRNSEEILNDEKGASYNNGHEGTAICTITFETGRGEKSYEFLMAGISLLLDAQPQSRERKVFAVSTYYDRWEDKHGDFVCNLERMYYDKSAEIYEMKAQVSMNRQDVIAVINAWKAGQ